MSKYAKGISALVAASLTGVLTVLATVFGPKNRDPEPPIAGPAGPTYLNN